MKDELIVYHKTTTLLAIPRLQISYFSTEPSEDKIELFAYQIVGAETRKISLGKFNNTNGAKEFLIEWWQERQLEDARSTEV